jgi:hypothetical protein
MQQKAEAPEIPPPANRSRANLNQNREENPRKQEIVLRVVSGEPSEPTVALCKSERDALEECEGIVEQGLGTCFEVGDALLRIRDNRLYRDTYTTFEQYCQERWHLGRSYAWRVMGAAERIKLLPSGDNLPRPANEFQMRPFLKLAPEEFPGAWKRAVKTAKEGRVTLSVVKAVIRELLANNQGLVRSGKKGKRSKSKGKWPGGQVLVLLTEAKRQIKNGESDKALAALERIESLLFPG